MKLYIIIIGLFYFITIKCIYLKQSGLTLEDHRRYKVAKKYFKE